jgi:hypothetical protein
MEALAGSLVSHGEGERVQLNTSKIRLTTDDFKTILIEIRRLK